MNSLFCNICFLSLYLDAVIAQVPYTAIPRWGQAVTLLNDLIYVQGGKTDPQGGLGYSSAQANNDLLSLSLSSPFDNTSVPWQLLSSQSNTSTSQGPAVAWHSISAFNTSGILVFGGEGNPGTFPPNPDGSDSAWLLDVNDRVIPQFIQESASWGAEPMRRFHHTSVTAATGKVYIVGGQKTDGSGNTCSDNFVFDPNGPSFTPLPSDNGPQEITRHGSVILNNGQLLVFGGYSTATSSLVNFSTIWSLDTTQSTPTWSTLNVSSGLVPPSRRDFAYTLLSGSRVLIHGGIDGDTSDYYNNVYSDGWILDASQTASIWTEVPSLSQLGPRFDHFAVGYGSIVIFGFGYQQNLPAPALVQIYNSSGSGSFIPTYTPPSPSQSQTATLPGETSTAGQTTSGINTSSNPTSTNGGGGPDNPPDAAKKTTGLAVGIALGVLALSGIVIALFIFLRKKRREELFRQSFMALRDDNENSPHDTPVRAKFGEKNGQPGDGWKGMLRNLGVPAALGLLLPGSHARSPPARRDMLAEEDSRDFGQPYRRRQGSSWSLRSMLGRKSREQSILSTTGRWGDKDPFSDGAALMTDEETGFVGAAVPGATRPTARRDYSYTSTLSARSYVDPFADPIQEEPRSYHEEEPSEGSSSHPHLEIQTLLHLSMEPHVLSPVTEMSRNTSSFGTPSVSSHTSSLEPRLTPFEDPSALTLATSANSRSPHPSSIIDATPHSSQHVRRSDSWWARFSRTSFLDRGNDLHNRRLDFRDPNPPPRLMAIEESQHSGSPTENDKDSPGSHRSNSLKHGLSAMVRKKGGGAHGKSTSSLRTADSEAIERMAGMDVAQHERTGSHRTRDSTSTSIETRSEDPHWLPQDDSKTGQGAVEHEQIFTSPVDATDFGEYQDHPLAPTKTSTPPTQTPPGTSAASSATSLSSGGGERPPSSPGGVSARVREYERRLSQDMEVLSPTNTKHREERPRKSSHVGYGLVPRPSLFVANPDHRQLSSSDIDT